MLRYWFSLDWFFSIEKMSVFMKFVPNYTSLLTPNKKKTSSENSAKYFAHAQIFFQSRIAIFHSPSQFLLPNVTHRLLHLCLHCICSHASHIYSKQSENSNEDAIEFSKHFPANPHSHMLIRIQTKSFYLSPFGCFCGFCRLS